MYILILALWGKPEPFSPPIGKDLRYRKKTKFLTKFTQVVHGITGIDIIIITGQGIRIHSNTVSSQVHQLFQVSAVKASLSLSKVCEAAHSNSCSVLEVAECSQLLLISLMLREPGDCSCSVEMTEITLPLTSASVGSYTQHLVEITLHTWGMKLSTQ